MAPAATSDEAKDHVLFVGTDLAVKEGNEFCHVVGAKKGSVQIEKGHRLAEVRLGPGANIKVSRGVKLSRLSATISDVRAESIDHASARAQLAAMQASMVLTADASDRADLLQGKMTLLSATGVNMGPGHPVGAEISDANLKVLQGAAASDYRASLPKLDELTSSLSTHLVQNFAHGDTLDDEVTLDASALPGLKLLGDSASNDSTLSGSANPALSQANVSAGSTEVELTFNVSSPTPLDHAYIVVVANYGSTNKPDEVARQISTREFDHIDSHPQRVKMSHAASVNGRPFRKFDMGLYANGQEVATNLSEKRLALTSDQAFQFFLIDYLSSHKGATLPPTAVLMTPRSEFRRQVENIPANQTIYANVDKTGTIATISTDAAGTQRLPSALELALQNVRFMPALEKGAPVNGRVKVTLAQLAN